MQASLRHWSRQSHAALFSTPYRTNILFATLLLGLQRLETARVLPQAHYSMLEDMLEGWTYVDGSSAVLRD